MSDLLTHALETSLDKLPTDAQIVVGYSGGLDSTVLLHLLVNRIQPEQLKAVHVNHGLSPLAEQWQRHCESIAQQWGVSCVAERVCVSKQGKGVEDAARAQRYRVFQQHLLVNGAVLLLGHHQDDQQETVLLRMLRGSGLKGLAGMPDRRTLAQGSLLRPLLTVPRSEIHAYAKHHNLQWVEDASNQTTAFDRNFLRNRVLPLINRRWPGAAHTMGRAADWCREQDALLSDLAELDLATLDLQTERLGVSVLRQPFFAWRSTRQANVLRYLCHQVGVAAPAQRHWHQIAQQFLSDMNQLDNKAVVSWPGANLARFKQRLYLLPLLPQALSERVIWSGVSPLSLPGGGSLEMVPGGELRWDGQPIEVRPRQARLRVQPVGRNQSQSLKKVLQEANVEPWLRDCAPLLFQNQRLLAVADLWVERSAQSTSREQGMSVIWRPA